MEDFKVSRRDFAKGMAFGALGLAGAGLTGCAPKSQSSELALTAGGDVDWDDEFDFIVIGSGTGLIGALAAAEEGGRVLVLEKANTIGGVTFTISGNSQWVPGNNVQGEAGFPYQGDEKTLQYLVDCDAGKGSSRERKLDYVLNARKVNEWCQDHWGFRHALTNISDYYHHEYAQKLGHSIDFLNQATGEVYAAGSDVYAAYIEPLLDGRDVEIMTGTPATALVRADGGRILGVRAGKKAFAASKGVLVACGGFDYDEDMVRRYLNVPLGATQAAPDNTGDGIKMGQAVGADLENMAATWGGCALITDLGGEINLSVDNIFDYGTYRGLPFCITVDRSGRRFFNESCSYAASSNVYDGYDSGANRLAHVPAFMIFSETYVEVIGWPSNGASYDVAATADAASEMPSYVRRFETLEELAEEMGINAVNLAAEVEKFNGFCSSGVDEDFQRGSGPFDEYDETSYGFTSDTWPLVSNLPNKALGPITAPYYVVVEAPGAVNTCGGLRVNKNFQVLDAFGEVIEGLYASGSSCGGPLGSCYGGAGGAVGPGYYGAFKAADVAMGYGLV
ncbi:FAD-binding protein, partial [Adlercreutzia shanghongiae]